jgi:pilus assembly protein Flp/PilA
MHPLGELVQWCQLKEASMSRFISRFLKNESGATAIEYGLIAALIAVVIIGAVTSAGGAIDSTFQTVATALNP